jgi:lysophospholipase L1-like esterase
VSSLRCSSSGAPSRRRGATALSLLRGFALVFLALIFLEYSAGVLRHPERRLEQILEIFERHPTRLWALRSNLSENFEGSPLHTNDGGHRGEGAEARGKGIVICCLGDSLTFGWGVGDDDPYPSLLERAVAARCGDKQARVHNLGVPGYTSWQGKRVVKEEVLPLRPSLVTLCFGVNDVFKFRFFVNDGRRDSQLKAGSALVAGIENLAMSTNIYHFSPRAQFRRQRFHPVSEEAADPVGLLHPESASRGVPREPDEHDHAAAAPWDTGRSDQDAAQPAARPLGERRRGKRSEAPLRRGDKDA